MTKEHNPLQTIFFLVSFTAVKGSLIKTQVVSVGMFYRLRAAEYVIMTEKRKMLSGFYFLDDGLTVCYCGCMKTRQGREPPPAVTQTGV